MDDRFDIVFGKDLLQHGLVGCIAQVKTRSRCHSPAEAGRQSVDHHHVLAGIQQGPDHMAADIAGTARYQYRHVLHPWLVIAGALARVI